MARAPLALAMLMVLQLVTVGSVAPASRGARAPGGAPPLLGQTGGLQVVERSGATFSSSALIQRMAFQRSNVSRDDPCGLTGCTSPSMAFQLSSAGGFALRDWGLGGEYATQAHLVAQKLASLGGAEDLDYLRQELLKESVTDGVCHVSGTQWHMGYQGAWEVNAEWIMSVQSYIAHSGDADYTDRVPERLVCVESAPGSKPVLATATRKGPSFAYWYSLPAAVHSFHTRR